MPEVLFRPLLFLSAAMAAFTPLAAVAQQGQCGPRAAVVEHLASKYSETRRSIGIAANNTVMEVYASSDTGTWTITVTTVQGMTCLVASGQGFEAMQEDLPASDSPA